MKQWFNATELAGLASLPGTVRGVNKAADREAWQRRKRQRGKGWEYHIDSLPAATQQYLRRQAAVALCNQSSAIELPDTDATIKAERNNRLIAKETGLKRLASLPSNHPKKQRAQAREWVLRRWADFAQTHAIRHAACVNEFIHAYQSGEIAVPETHAAWLPVRHGARSLDSTTLFRWRKAYREKGLAGLMDGYGNRKGRSKIAQHPELQKIVLGCLFQQPHITAKKIKDYLQARHPDLDIVSIKSIERYISIWQQDNAQVWTYLTNPDQWKNVYMAAFGSHHERIERLNQVWEMDSTPGDWMLTDGRHVVIGAIDMYSRRLRFRVSKSSKAEAVCATFRDGVLAWGVPEAVRTDNGSDYVSQQFDGVLRDLEIIHELCVPFASEQKGTIERVMRTMSHGILDLLPGFIGHNVAQRKVIEARKSFAQRIMTPGEVVEVALSAAELQQRLDQWCEHVYAHDSHHGLNKQTPFQVASAWTGAVRRISDERALDALLAEIAGIRTVTKKGIRFEHYHYIAPELVGLIGRDVRLKHDADDMGRLYVYAQDGAFVCVAQAHELLGISRGEAAAVARAQQKQLLAQQRNELKQNKRAVRENIADVVLQHRIAQSKKITAFPQPSEHYSTGALDAAGVAARANSAPTSTTDIDIDTFRREFQQQPAQIVETDDPKRRYARWARIEQRITRGECVSEEDRRGLQRYQSSDEYQSMKEFYEDFGLSIDAEVR